MKLILFFLFVTSIMYAGKIQEKEALRNLQSDCAKKEMSLNKRITALEKMIQKQEELLNSKDNNSFPKLMMKKSTNSEK